MKKMLFIIIFQGGLGNQLFILAKSLRLLELYGGNHVFEKNIGFIRNKKYKTTYRLDFYRNKLAKEKEHYFVKLYKLRLFRFLIRCISSFVSTNCFPIIVTDSSEKVSKTNYVDGYFLSCPSREIISTAYKYLFLEHSHKLPVQKIDKICLHLRNFSSTEKDVSIEWYEAKVIQILCEIYETYGNIEINIFSPLSKRKVLDQKLIKCIQNHTYNFDLKIVSRHSGSEMDDFALMTRYKYFIIPDSTFSCWAAYFASLQAHQPLVYMLGDDTAKKIAMPNWDLSIYEV